MIYLITPLGGGESFELEDTDCIAAMAEASRRLGTDQFSIRRKDAPQWAPFGVGTL